MQKQSTVLFEKELKARTDFGSNVWDDVSHDWCYITSQQSPIRVESSEVTDRFFFFLDPLD